MFFQNSLPLSWFLSNTLLNGTHCSGVWPFFLGLRGKEDDVLLARHCLGSQPILLVAFLRGQGKGGSVGNHLGCCFPLIALFGPNSLDPSFCSRIVTEDLFEMRTLHWIGLQSSALLIRRFNGRLPLFPEKDGKEKFSKKDAIFPCHA